RRHVPDYSKYKELKLGFEGRLLTITIDRPEARNALTPSAHVEFEELWLDIAVDDSIGAVILTGSGNQAFSAGGDVKGMRQRSAAGESPVRTFVGAKRILANMFEVEQPIIGAINGDAIGMGCSLAFGC